ncbi:hypothetical protein BMS3Bbin04_00949 [bacterium BMS3Bbin04]|nr:hypothetical protein BMS3Bbin04_00949 [bacterium BMS3Bbin04]
MNFIYDIDLLLQRSRGVLNGFAELANIINLIVGGTVNLDHIQGIPGSDIKIHHIVRIQIGKAIGIKDRIGIIDRHREKTRSGRLAHTARTGKDVGMRHPSTLNRALQGPCNVFLADNIRELLRTPATCHHQI